MSTVFLGVVSFGFLGNDVQASEAEVYTNSDIQNVVQIDNTTKVYMPNDIVVTLEDFHEDLSNTDIEVSITEPTRLKRAAFGFPDKIWATTSIANRNGPGSVYVERSKSKPWISGGYKVAHYRGNIPRKRVQMVANKWYSIYEGNIGIHYIGSN